MNILMRSGVSTIVVPLVLISVKLSEETIQPTTFSFAAQRTTDGTNLLFKDSNSNETSTTSFPGFNLSSPTVCGQNYERCPLCVFGATVDMEAGGSVELVVVMVPLRQSLGVVIFDNRTDTNQLTFRDSRVISGEFSCELTKISMVTLVSTLVSAIGVCLKDTLTQVSQVTLSFSLLDLTMSGVALVNPPCLSTNFSEFIVFESGSFRDGVVVFVAENGRGGQNVHFQRPRERCQSPDDDGQSICSPVEHFVAISATQQAAYCDDETSIVDIDSNNPFPVLQRSKYGLPFFCSDSIFIGYGNNSLTVFQNGDKMTTPMNFPYGDDILFGECVYLTDQFFAVAQLSNGTVLIANLNESETMVLEESVTPPMVFEHSILLTTETNVVVRSLLNEQFIDRIEGQTVVGAVVNGPIPTTLPPATETTPTDTTGTAAPTDTTETDTPTDTTGTPTDTTGTAAPTDMTGTDTPTDTTRMQSQSSEVGAIVGGVVGVVAPAIIIAVFLVCFWCWCHGRPQRNAQALEEYPLSDLPTSFVPPEDKKIVTEGAAKKETDSEMPLLEEPSSALSGSDYVSSNKVLTPQPVQDGENLPVVLETASSNHNLDSASNNILPQEAQNDGFADAMVVEAGNFSHESDGNSQYLRPETSQDLDFPVRALKLARREEDAEYYLNGRRELPVTTTPQNEDGRGNIAAGNNTGSVAGNDGAELHNAAEQQVHGEEGQDRGHGQEEGDRRHDGNHGAGRQDKAQDREHSEGGDDGS